MAFDAIHNYYETLVLEQLNATLLKASDQPEQDFIEDVACVALNSLPARYVRHNVDMVFYMTPEERTRMEQDVASAVTTAWRYVEGHRRDKPQR